jgi:hypothetical protein
MTLPSDRSKDTCHRWFHGFLEVCPEIRVSLKQFRLRPIEHILRPSAYSPKDIQGTALLRHQGVILRRRQIATAQFSVYLVGNRGEQIAAELPLELVSYGWPILRSHYS